MKKLLVLMLAGGVWLLSLPIKAEWVLDVKFDPSRDHSIIAKVIRWDETDERPNPIYGCHAVGAWYPGKCKVYIWYEGPSGAAFIGEVSFPEMGNPRKVGELARLFREKGYLNREFMLRYVRMPEGATYCITFRASSDGVSRPIPGGIRECTKAEIIPTYCSISELSIELDHGAIGANSVNGNTVSRPFRVSCSNDFKLRIMSEDSSGVLSLGGGLQSQLKVNGVDLDSGFVDTVGSGGKTFTLTSTLSGYSSGTGVFQGSKVMILSLP
ncbi:PapG chaperone-binding domain-containing protein [Serratia marcescens]